MEMYITDGNVKKLKVVVDSFSWIYFWTFVTNFKVSIEYHSAINNKQSALHWILMNDNDNNNNDNNRHKNDTRKVLFHQLKKFN